METISQAALTFLVNSIWQVALFAGIAETGSRLLRGAPARYRHALWVVTFLAAIALPLASLHVRVTGLRAAPFSPPLPAVAARPLAPGPAAASLSTGAPLPTQVSKAWFALWPAGAHRSLPIPPVAARVLLILYLVFFLYRLCRLGRAWFHTRRIRAGASPVTLPASVVAAAARCAQAMGIRPGRNQAGESVLCSSRVHGPVTLGARHPVIILPAGLAACAAPDDLAAAMAHEMAHIVRRDYLKNLVYELLFLPVSFHPAAAFIRRRISETRELACDDMAAAALNPSAYAHSLLSMARHLSRLAPSAVACPEISLGVFDAGILEERIMRLLAKKSSSSASLTKVFLGLSWLLLAASCLVASGFSLGVARNGRAEKTGAISGIVVDPSGARVPNAQVQLINIGSKSAPESTVTDAEGKFLFKGLQEGRYNLQVAGQGFVRAFRSFTFHPSTPAPFFPFILQLGSVQEAIVVTAQAPPGTSAQNLPVVDKAKRIRVGGSVEAAKRIHSVNPEYPKSAKSRGVQGLVLLEAVISTNGQPLSLKVFSSPDEDLSKAALTAVKQWRYRPTLLNGEPVEVITQIAVDFVLAQ